MDIMNCYPKKRLSRCIPEGSLLGGMITGEVTNDDIRR